MPSICSLTPRVCFATFLQSVSATTYFLRPLTSQPPLRKERLSPPDSWRSSLFAALEMLVLIAACECYYFSVSFFGWVCSLPQRAACQSSCTLNQNLKVLCKFPQLPVFFSYCSLCCIFLCLFLFCLLSSLYSTSLPLHNHTMCCSSDWRHWWLHPVCY